MIVCTLFQLNHFLSHVTHASLPAAIAFTLRNYFSTTIRPHNYTAVGDGKYISQMTHVKTGSYTLLSSTEITRSHIPRWPNVTFVRHNCVYKYFEGVHNYSEKLCPLIIHPSHFRDFFILWIISRHDISQLYLFHNNLYHLKVFHTIL